MDLSTNDPAFLSRAESWLAERGEIQLLLRYSRAAGRKEFLLVRSRRSLSDTLARLAPATSILLFRERQLPLRAVAGPALRRDAFALIPDGAEFVALQLEPDEYGEYRHCAGESHNKLAAVLDEWAGKLVAIGLYPSWLSDTTDVMEAVAPDLDGLVHRGIY